AIEYHKENIHCNPQLQQMMQRLSSPEEIARWRQDRVRNFPTKDNIARKVFLKRLTQLIHNSYKSSKSERIEVDDLVEISSLLPGEIQERPYGQDKLQGGSNDKRKRRQETSGSYRRDKKHKEGHTRKPLSDDKQEKIETSTKSQEQENETKHIQLEKTSKTEGIDPTARCCTEEKTTVEGNPQGIVHSKQETKEVADETIREEELPLKNSDDEVPEETAIAKRGEDIFKREDEDRMSNPVNKTQLCRKYLQKRFIHDIEAQKEHIMQMRQKRSERDSKNRARKEKTEKKATLLQKKLQSPCLLLLSEELTHLKQTPLSGSLYMIVCKDLRKTVSHVKVNVSQLRDTLRLLRRDRLWRSLIELRRERQGLDSPMPQDMRQAEKEPDRPPIVVAKEVSQVPEEVTITTEKEIALPASDLLIANQVGLGLPQWLRDMRMYYGNLTGVWKKLHKMGSPILIGNNNINNNTLRTLMHDIDYRRHAFREDNKSLMLLFIRGIESKNHALQNYTMSFTSTLPIKSWDEFLAGVWHLLYDVNAMEKAIQKLNSARQSVGQPVLAWRNELEQKAMEVSPVLATQPILARLFHGGLLDIIKSSSIDHFPVGGFTTVQQPTSGPGKPKGQWWNVRVHLPITTTALPMELGDERIVTSLMLLFIRGIESKNHALQNYTMSFTSTLPIKSWDEFLAGVWHLLYDVNAMEKAIQKLNSARQSVGQPVLAWRNELEQKAMEVSPVLATQPILARLFHGGLLDIIKSSSIDHFPVGGFTTVAAAYKWAWEAERRITQFKPLTGANHTNTNPTVAVPILARLFHGGLLDIIKSSSIDHFPVGGFTTVAAAYKWAWEAERRITQFKPLTGSNHTNTNPTVAVVERPRTSTNNNHGLAHGTGGREDRNGRRDDRDHPRNNRRNDDNRRNDRSDRNNASKGRRPMGTPTGILYLWKDEQGVKHVTSAIASYRESKRLCIRCGSDRHTALCQGKIPRCDAAYIQVVDRDFDPTRPRLNTVEAHGFEQRSVTLDIWDLGRRQINATLPVLIDTGADVSYITPSVARSYAREQWWNVRVHLSITTTALSTELGDERIVTVEGMIGIIHATTDGTMTTDGTIAATETMLPKVVDPWALQQESFTFGRTNKECGSDRHTASCQGKIPRCDKAYIQVVDRDFDPTRPRLNTVEAHGFEQRSVALDIWDLGRRQINATLPVLIDTGADVSYITPSVARSYAREVSPHPHPYHPIGANSKPFDQVRE
ncbi:eukaryotic translation initiation factor 5B, partial [Planoprotostelium fungivorum]